MARRKKRERIGDTFKTVGQPSVTYVARKKGKYEAILSNALLTSGQLCLITGPSKTGKTTLYKKVLSEIGKEPLVVRCDRSIDPTEFWSRALESINFDRLRELASEKKLGAQFGTKIAGEIGWAWLGKLIGEVSLDSSVEVTDAIVKEKILSNPSPMHLIPVLKKLPLVLVVEDYHYLNEITQMIIFQQWKNFVDEEVSVVVVGTTHHAIDIVNANKDLIGRKCHIDVQGWSKSDLQQIVIAGFDFLEIEIGSSDVRIIADESMGLPIITQHVCESVFTSQGVFEHVKGDEIDVNRDQVHKAFSVVANEKFGELRKHYNRLITGPRKKARKYDTYELVLSCFAQNPLTFELARHEITERLEEMRLIANRTPPVASVNSTLNALAGFQKRTSFELLEWRKEEQVLYMLEPSFLFFLRWGVEKKGQKIGNLPVWATVLRSLVVDFPRLEGLSGLKIKGPRLPPLE